MTMHLSFRLTHTGDTTIASGNSVTVCVNDEPNFSFLISALRKLGVEEWLVSAVMSICTGAKTVVRTFYGNSNGFEVKVGMHQDSALSP